MSNGFENGSAIISSGVFIYKGRLYQCSASNHVIPYPDLDPKLVFNMAVESSRQNFIVVLDRLILPELENR